jgi:cytochrome d ubiquinol oxidase subunit II
MMNSVAPVWDGNETWLVLGGGGLLAVFPLAYAIALPALYMPLILMLLGLVFRGVAFEFRWRTERLKPLWNAGFFGGSLVAALCQGIALGALVQGIEVSGRAYGGGWWDWLTPFSVTTGVALAVGYALLGATWLIMKTEGPVATRARRQTLPLAGVTLALMGVVSLWTPALQEFYLDRWFGYPMVLWSAAVPVLALALAYALYRGIRTGHDRWPFLAALGLFVIAYVGVGISFYPYMIPPTLTIADAAAPDDSLAFLLVGAVVLVPMVLGYTAYAYWVFRGKVKPGEGYH